MVRIYVLRLGSHKNFSKRGAGATVKGMEITENKIVIKGITANGQKFRPSDWAQRLTGAISSLGPGRRIIPHPMVSVSLIDGIPCVILDQALEKLEPMLYSFLTKFADSNRLQIEAANEHQKQA